MRHTFSFKHLSLLKSLSLNQDERVALMTREIVRNAEEHGAKNVELLSATRNNKKYMIIAHDGNPFSSLDHLKDCLTPNTSGDCSGIQGSGMKLAMFLGAEKENAELIIHSKNDGLGFSARLVCGDLNDAVVEDCPEMNEFLPAFFGKFYKRFTVFCLYRFQESGVVYTSKNIALLMDLCPVENVTVSYLAHCSLGGQSDIRTFEDAMKESKRIRHRIYFSATELKKAFCVDEESFVVEGLSHPDVGGTFNVAVNIEIYPGITDRSGTWYVMDKNSEDFGKRVIDVDVSNQSLFLSYDKDLINRRTLTGKNVSRLFKDPVFTSLHAHGLLATLGMICPKNKNFIPKINSYPYAKSSDGVCISGEKWSPVVKMRFKILDSEALSSLKLHEFVARFGGINEFFYCENSLFIRDILDLAVSKLAETNPPNLISLRSRMKVHFPFSEDCRLPIPSEEFSDSNVIEVFKRNSSGQLDRLFSIDPGQVEKRVELRFKDGSPVECDFDHVTKGFSLDRKSGNVFDLLVDDLSMVDEHGNIVVVTESEYRHAPNFMPKKICNVDIGKERYRLNLKCNIPKLESTHGKVRVSNKAGEGAFSCKNYFSGLPGEYGRFSNSNGLMINDANPVIRQIVCRDKDKYPWLTKSWSEIYKTLARISREVMNEFKKRVDVHVLSECKEELERAYEDASSYYLNTHLSVFFKYDTSLLSLREKISREIDEEVKDEEFGDSIEAVVETDQREERSSDSADSFFQEIGKLDTVPVSSVGSLI